MNAVKDDVIKLVEKELESANKQFPQFRSAHEGVAIILEEMQETQDEVDRCLEWLEELWKKIRNNENGISCANNLRSYAICGAIEFIQVAAMCQKYIDSLNGGES